MPALAHLYAHLIFGALTGYWARRAPSLQHHWLGWPLALCFVFEALLLVPVATYGARIYPSHALGYAVGPETYPGLGGATGWLSLALVVGDGLMLCLGLMLTREALLRQRRVVAWLPVAVATVALGAYLMDLGPLAWRFGSYSALWAGNAAPWSQTPSAWVTLAAYGLSFAGTRYAARVAGDRPIQWP